MDKLISKDGDKNKITTLGERISNLNSTLGTMGNMEESSQVYALTSIQSNELGGLSYNHKTGTITIGYNGTANFVHEVTHGGQFESKDIAFSLTGNYTYGQDIYDEIAAYKAKYAYNPTSVALSPSSSSVHSSVDITVQWVQGIIYNGKNIYTPTGFAKTGLYPININSTKANLMRAYPNINPSGYSNTIPLRNMFPMHYKR